MYTPPVLVTSQFSISKHFSNHAKTPGGAIIHYNDVAITIYTLHNDPRES
jgi:hypothetical protein